MVYGSRISFEEFKALFDHSIIGVTVSIKASRYMHNNACCFQIMTVNVVK